MKLSNSLFIAQAGMNEENKEAILAIVNNEKLPLQLRQMAKDISLGVIHFIESFQKIVNADLSVNKAMNVLGMSGQLDLRMERYNKLRMKLFRKYGKPTLNDQIQITDENLEPFVKEMNELNAMEFELEGEIIDLAGEQVTLKAVDLVRLKLILSPLPEIKLPESEKVEDDEPVSTNEEEQVEKAQEIIERAKELMDDRNKEEVKDIVKEAKEIIADAEASIAARDGTSKKKAKKA